MDIALLTTRVLSASVDQAPNARIVARFGPIPLKEPQVTTPEVFLAPSPLAGEGWGEGAGHGRWPGSRAQARMNHLSLPSPARGEGELTLEPSGLYNSFNGIALARTIVSSAAVGIARGSVECALGSERPGVVVMVPLLCPECREPTNGPVGRSDRPRCGPDGQSGPGRPGDAPRRPRRARASRSAFQPPGIRLPLDRIPS